MSDTQDIDNQSFETALAELEKIVRNLETGDSPLEKSIDDYERGIKLKQHCEKKLRDAQAKIEKISAGENGNIQTQPLDE